MSKSGAIGVSQGLRVAVAMTVMVALVGVAPKSQAASGNVTCTMVKTSTYAGESVTITATVDATATEYARVIIEGPCGTVLADSGANRQGPASTDYTFTPQSTGTYACLGKIGTAITPSPAVGVTVMGSPKGQANSETYGAHAW